ncbi:MAG: hypothetical protein WD971_07375 [Pirellulales bacterium]
MSERRSFYRKVAYGLAIAVLLFPLALLSSPASMNDQGGKLARLRNDPEHPLSQASLGQIDPASETMKLATLGLRGVAVNLLWEKANYYKKTEDWTNLTATLEQLAKLQPNFITFWKFQAWNLTYNVSVEFDDYRDRYSFVRRGIQFLKEGEKYNRDNPHLLWDLGWFIGQKIGRADEHVQYRRLFVKDDDFHPADLPPDERDNWLVGKEYYLQGVDAVDNKGKSMGRKSPRIFYSSPAMSQMNYSEAIEEDGFFDKARRGWIQAQQEWEDFGRLPIEHSTGVVLHLGDEDKLGAEVKKLQSELDAMAPGLRETIAAERRSALARAEQAALDTPPEERTTAQMELAYQVREKIAVTDRQLAERIGKDNPTKKKEALQLASEIDRESLRLRYTINYKSDSNYDYWYTRAKLEQTPNALAAREAMFKASRAFRQGDPFGARKLYEDGFAKWRAVFDEFPMAIESESSTGDDLIQYILQYRNVLDQMDEQLSEAFPLWDVIERFDNEQKLQDELAAHKQRIGATQPEANPEAQPKAEQSPPATPAAEAKK